MAMLLTLQSGTRQDLDAKADAGHLLVGEPWLIEDERALAVAVAYNEYIVLPDKAIWFGADIDCEFYPPYPAARAGEVHRVSFPGKIGGDNGVEVAKNALLICRQDTIAGDHEQVGQYWTIINDTTQITQHTHADAETGGQLQHSALSGRDEADAHPQYVQKSLFDANTILKADSDNTPAALEMGASSILARLASGNIKAASVAEMLTLLNTAPKGSGLQNAGYTSVAVTASVQPAVSGTVTVSGLSFQPTIVFLWCGCESTVQPAASVGFFTSTVNVSLGPFNTLTGSFINWLASRDRSIILYFDGNNIRLRASASPTSDGFVVTWRELAGTIPTTTIYINYLALGY